MVERNISEDMKLSGERFLAKLDEFGLYPESAGWFYDAARSDWRFLIATAAIDVTGRRKIYGAIIDIFEAFDFGTHLTSFDVHLVSPREPWYAVMRGTIGVSGRSSVSLEDVTLNGVHIENAFVYRFFDAAPASALKKNVLRFAKEAEKAAAHAY